MRSPFVFRSWSSIFVVAALVASVAPSDVRACSQIIPSVYDFGPAAWDGRDDIPTNWRFAVAPTNFLRSDDFAAEPVWWMRALPDGEWELLDVSIEDDTVMISPAQGEVAPGEYQVASVSGAGTDAGVVSRGEARVVLEGRFTVTDQEAESVRQPTLLAATSRGNFVFDPLAFRGPSWVNTTVLEFRYARDPAASLYVLRSERGNVLAAEYVTNGRDDDVYLWTQTDDMGTQTYVVEVYDEAGRVIRADAFGNAGCSGACSQSGNRASFVALFALLLTLRVRRRREKAKTCSA